MQIKSNTLSKVLDRKVDDDNYEYPGVRLKICGNAQTLPTDKELENIFQKIDDYLIQFERTKNNHTKAQEAMSEIFRIFFEDDVQEMICDETSQKVDYDDISEEVRAILNNATIEV